MHDYCPNGGECDDAHCRHEHNRTACRYRTCTRRDCHFMHEPGQRARPTAKEPLSSSTSSSARFNNYRSSSRDGRDFRDSRSSRDGRDGREGRFEMTPPSPSSTPLHNRNLSMGNYNNNNNNSSSSCSSGMKLHMNVNQNNSHDTDWRLEGFDFSSHPNPMNGNRYRPMLLHPAYVGKEDRYNARLKFETNLMVLFSIIRHLGAFAALESFWDGVSNIRGNPWGASQTRDVFFEYRSARQAWLSRHQPNEGPSSSLSSSLSSAPLPQPTPVASYIDQCIRILENSPNPPPDPLNAFQARVKEWESKDRQIIDTIRRLLTNPSSSGNSSSIGKPMLPSGDSPASRSADVFSPHVGSTGGSTVTSTGRFSEEGGRQFPYTNTHDTRNPPTNSVYLSLLPVQVCEADLIDQFKRFGHISSVRIWKQKRCGFVNFDSTSSASAAIDHFNGKEVVPGFGSIACRFARPQYPYHSSGGSRDESPSPPSRNRLELIPYGSSMFKPTPSTPMPAANMTADPLDTLIEQESRKVLPYSSESRSSDHFKSGDPNMNMRASVSSALGRKRSATEDLLGNTPLKRKIEASGAGTTAPAVNSASWGPYQRTSQASSALPSSQPHSASSTQPSSGISPTEGSTFSAKSVNSSQEFQVNKEGDISGSLLAALETTLAPIPNHREAKPVNGQTTSDNPKIITVTPPQPAPASTVTVPALASTAGSNNSQGVLNNAKPPTEGTSYSSTLDLPQVAQLQLKLKSQTNVIKDLRNNLDAADSELRRLRSALKDQQMMAEESTRKLRALRGENDQREMSLRSREKSVRHREDLLSKSRVATPPEEDKNMGGTAEAAVTEVVVLKESEARTTQTLNTISECIGRLERGRLQSDSTIEAKLNSIQQQMKSFLIPAAEEKRSLMSFSLPAPPNYNNNNNISINNDHDAAGNDDTTVALTSSASTATDYEKNTSPTSSNATTMLSVPQAPSFTRQVHLQYLKPRDAKTCLDGIADELQALRSILHKKVPEQNGDDGGWVRMQYLSETLCAIDVAIDTTRKGVSAL